MARPLLHLAVRYEFDLKYLSWVELLDKKNLDNYVTAVCESDTYIPPEFKYISFVVSDVIESRGEQLYLSVTLDIKEKITLHNMDNEFNEEYILPYS